ncbi:MAG: CNP1-like family protein [Betaproteobacteria bacterium]|nr:CNP1-like family protein [Betaproteobacteria bacterium]
MGKLRIGRLLFFSVLVSASAAAADFDEDYAEKPWQEIETRLPAYPKTENLLPFFVSAATENRFMVDGESITVGTDGVVRYTLVVSSPSGALNVSYEGLRCSAMERRLYAFGRDDKAWSRARGNQWSGIRASVVNRQHAALYFEYFCPNGLIVRDAGEARSALRSGGHPSIKNR